MAHNDNDDDGETGTEVWSLVKHWRSLPQAIRYLAYSAYKEPTQVR